MRTLLLGFLLIGCGLLCQIVSSMKSPHDNLEDSAGVSEEGSQDMKAFIGKRDADMSTADLNEQPLVEMIRHKRSSHSRSHSHSHRHRISKVSLLRRIQQALARRRDRSSRIMKFRNHRFRSSHLTLKPRPRPRPRPTTTPKPTVPTKPPCLYQNTITCGENEKRYRTHSGECNNLDNQLYGRSHTPFKRILPPEYSGQNKDQPRKAADGSDLPNARLVSRKIHTKTEPFIPSESGASMMFATFGQVLTHDITLTKTIQHDDENEVCFTDDCRGSPDCFPITIPPNDPSKNFHNRTCIAFVRSKAGPPLDCSSDSREQINDATSFIDCSPVYGSSEEQNAQLRENGGKGAKLIMRDNGNDSKLKKLLPVGKHTLSLAGDPRADAHTSLAAFHTMFAREHNRIADKLSHFNGKLSDEELYNRARKILIACFQHITYNEFLPILLGDVINKNPGLQLEKTGYANIYDKVKNPGIMNAFATAFMRIGHSIVPSRLILLNKLGGIPTIGKMLPMPYFTHQCMFNSELLSSKINGSADFFLRGGCIHDAYRVDRHVTGQLTENLVANPKSSRVSDLAAYNIMRGRDHGIKAYIHWREKAGLTVPKTFEDLTAIFGDSKIVEHLKTLYGDVKNIDVFVGMLLEPHPGTSLVGATASFFLAKQFEHLRTADRFWYENEPKDGHTFTPEQLAEIRKCSLAKLICNNMDSITEICKNPLIVSFETTDCKDIPDVDLSKFAH